MILVFDSGNIYPDPSVCDPDETIQLFQKWWPSAEFLPNKVPNTKLVVSITSQIISPRGVRYPITLLLRGT